MEEEAPTVAEVVKHGNKAKKGKKAANANKEIPPPPESPIFESTKMDVMAEKLSPPSSPSPKDESLLLLGSREAERDLLVMLNKRLEKIIERNRQLQQANNQLKTELEFEKTQSSAKVTEVTVKVNAELDELRGELANAKKELTTKGFQLDDAKKDAADAKKRLNRVETEDKENQRRIAALEGDLADATTQLKKEKDAKAKVQRELEQWKEEAIKSGEVLKDTKTELEKEILAKHELEKELKSKIQESNIKTTMIESEMVQLKASHVELMQEENARQQKEFENLLAKAMDKLRQEYIQKLIENKEEQQSLYERKEKDHIRDKENLDALFKKKTLELEQSLSNIKDLTQKVRKLETERHALLVQLDDLEQERKDERERLQKEIEGKDKIIADKVAEFQSLLGHCQNLLDTKVALDNELAAYKSLLETEEVRLKIGEKDENYNDMVNAS